jgi:hypothetical protein
MLLHSRDSRSKSQGRSGQAFAVSDDIAVTLPGPRIGPQTGEDSVVQPDKAPAALVGLVLVAHAARRERGGGVLERRLRERERRMVPRRASGFARMAGASFP